MFYTFTQNNSGGSFHFDAAAGISHYVIVEAPNKEAAIERAEAVGLYFDGAGDCPCCGDRWAHWCDENDTPMVYNQAPQEFVKDGKFLWMKPNPEVFIHYADVRKEGV